MTNLKKLMMTATMAGILLSGLTSAKAGLMLSDFRSTDAPVVTETKEDKGVILDLTEGIILNLTGVIILF